jgi:hypothetical protein
LIAIDGLERRLLPYLGVGILAVVASFLISHVVIRIISFALNLTLRMFKRNSQKTISNSNNAENLVDFIKINRPNKTPFPKRVNS